MQPVRYCPQCGKRLEVGVDTVYITEMKIDPETLKETEGETREEQRVTSYCESCDMTYEIMNHDESGYIIDASKGIAV